MAPRFVHLRMHSEFSVADGIVRIDEAVQRAAEDGMPALALTDAANVFGMVKFYGAARRAGIKPIVGIDCWLQNDADRDKPHRLLLLCASRAGYLRLCDLLSRAWLQLDVIAPGEKARPVARQALRGGGVAGEQRLADVAAGGPRQGDQPLGVAEPLAGELRLAAVLVLQPRTRQQIA
jgi:DNA polymerase-3 subunit alpha